MTTPEERKVILKIVKLRDVEFTNMTSEMEARDNREPID